jgi:type IV pilus assembly protein PilQ
MGKSIKQFVLTLVAFAFVSSGVSFADDSANTTQTNQIEKIDVISLAGDKMGIKLTLTQPMPNPPAGFTLGTPPRIALDFPNITNGTPSNSIKVGQGTLVSINLAQGKGRTRVVLDLTKASSYTTSINGKEVSILLQPQESASMVQPSVTKFADSGLADQPHTLKNIDFMRGKNGEGRIIVDLSDTSTGIDIRRQSNTLIVDFAKTDLPSNLERRLNVVNFNTPVLNVDAMKQGKNARIVIEPKGNWEHASYQADKKFIIDVKPLIDDPNKLVQGSRPGYNGEKLSLNFQNIEVRSVLQVIADFTGFNIITSDTVSGSITLRLKDVPWDQAMDIIMESKGLAMRKSGNVIWVAPSDELAAKQKMKLEAAQQLDDLDGLQTQVFVLKYQKADAFKTMLVDPKQKILSKRGSAVIDARTNTVFVQDTPKHLDDVRRILSVIDIPVRQVLIESRIVIADQSLASSIGSKFGIQKRGGTVSVAGSQTQSQALTNVQGTAAASLGGTDLMSNLATTGTGLGSIGVSIFSAPLGALINLEIEASEAVSKSKTISSPRVITTDQKKAIINSGVEIPYQQASSSGATNVSFKDAVLSLSVTPHITPDDKINMELEVHKDDVGSVYNGVPSINTRQINTEVLVGNGDTAVLGGIYEDDTTNTVSKVPFFGDLPLFGNLFKNKNDTSTKTELLIFITPKIIQDLL